MPQWGLGGAPKASPASEYYYESPHGQYWLRLPNLPSVLFSDKERMQRYEDLNNDYKRAADRYADILASRKQDRYESANVRELLTLGQSLPMRILDTKVMSMLGALRPKHPPNNEKDDI